jgi:hypothetical protein
MPSDNSANEANFEELRAHCETWKSRAAAKAPEGSTCVDTLCDYWERAVQMRIMHNETLQLEKAEQAAQHARELVRWRWFAGALVGSIAAFSGVTSPEAWQAVYEHVHEHATIERVFIYPLLFGIVLITR